MRARRRVTLLLGLPLASQPLALGTLSWRETGFQEGHVLLGQFIALRPSQQPPLVSFDVILRQPLTIGIDETEIVLSEGVSSIGCFAKPFHHGNAKLWHGAT